MSMTKKYTKIKIGSLNCRSLAKSSQPNTRKLFIRFLRSLHYDILTFQETHASNQNIQDLLNMELQAKQSFWTQHCGIVSFNPEIIIEPIFSKSDQRAIYANITHAQHLFEPFQILTIYAPSQAGPRQTFYKELYQLPPIYDTSHLRKTKLLITGDFNYSLREPRGVPRKWADIIHTHLFNCRENMPDSENPTFRRGETMSSIDYIYATKPLHQHLIQSQIDFVEPSWTDHALLTVSIKFGNDKQGPGLWRANPLLAEDKKYCKFLEDTLTKFFHTLKTTSTPQEKWDMVKKEIKKVTQSFGRRRSAWREKTLKNLQSSRTKLLRQYKGNITLVEKISPIEEQIGAIQKEIADVAALRAGRHWRENGETSAGYLKRTITARAIKKLIPSLQHPTSYNTCSEPKAMQDAARCYYQNLYSPDPIDQPSVDRLLDSVLPEERVSSSEAEAMTRLLTLQEIQEGSKRSPRRSSPGCDGIPYEILSLVFQHPLYATLVTQIYNDALTESLIPASWHETCVSLLPKKGDLTLLSNWRPISLINTDAKVFTRMLTKRLKDVAARLVCPAQTGFLPNRFIGDNGMMLNLITAHAKLRDDKSIGLMLDQEKAYDRIHPSYLRQVMQRFGIPSSIILAIERLFFGTQIRINVNGHLTDSVQQKRGLRQGDPLSPLLFNFAFDPFLRSILQHNAIQGFNFSTLINTNSTTPPPPIKIMAYADDVVLFLRDQADFLSLQTLIETYAQASNAKLNYNKSQAFSLSGSPLPDWSSILANHQITSWHDRNSPMPLIYLGFPICFSKTQQNRYVEQLQDKVQKACDIHSQRQLSVRGRATVLNSLLYSKLWHVLRLLPLTQQQLSKFRSIGHAFLTHRSFPKIRFDYLVAHRHDGGLGVLNPKTQQLTLQWVWLQPLLLQTETSPVLKYLSYTIRSFCDSPDPLLPLLFPTARPGKWRYGLNTLTLLMRAADVLPRRFYMAHPNPTTCLSIPLTHTWLTTPHHDPPKKPGLQRLKAADAFVYDNVTRVVRRRSPGEMVTSPQLVRTVFRALDRQEILLDIFFIRTCIPNLLKRAEHDHPGSLNLAPFVVTMGTKEHAIDSLSARSVRKIMNLSPPHPSFHPTLTSNQWKTFWRLPILHSARNVWFRAIHRKLPTRSLLHSLMPTQFLTPQCPHCLEADESFDHFLFLCPVKWETWQTLWSMYFETPCSIQSLHNSVLSIDLPTRPNVSFPAAGQVIACGLQAIWRGHWAKIFSNTSLTSLNMVQQTIDLLRTLSG